MVFLPTSMNARRVEGKNMAETEFEELLRMTAWNNNTNVERLRECFETIAQRVKADFDFDLKITDVRPELLGAYYGCSTGMRETLIRFFVKNFLPDIKELRNSCPT